MNSDFSQPVNIVSYWTWFQCIQEGLFLESPKYLDVFTNYLPAGFLSTKSPTFDLQGNPVEYTIMEFAEMISATVGK